MHKIVATVLFGPNPTTGVWDYLDDQSNHNHYLVLNIHRNGNQSVVKLNPDSIRNIGSVHKAYLGTVNSADAENLRRL